MKYTFLAALLLSSVALGGCASSLDVKDVNGKVAPGVPFRAGQLYLMTGEYTKHSELPTCVDAAFVKPVALPTGDQYYANVNPAEFAKTGFVMKFNDQGGLSEISLNSEPSSGEIVKNVADAAGTILPFLGVVGAATPANADPRNGQGGSINGPACDTSPDPTKTKYVRFTESTLIDTIK